MSTSKEQRKTREPLSRIKIGVVVSDKRDRTRAVEVDYQQEHAKYGKRLRRQAKFHVHDETNASKVGDKVEIAPCRPMSKTKAWRLIRVVEAAPEAIATTVR
ncbi:MAG: 30S ribosomal protein S17 [Phycisphaeraceae bacterium]